MLTLEGLSTDGQHGHLVQTPAGNLLWDPPGFVNDDAVEWIRSLGGVVAIVASHPHLNAN